jgi:putative colanic acid biosynthesis acetyltransferase WcaF
VAWQIVYFLLFRLSPKPLHAWRRAILRLFGARLGHGSVVHSSVKIWAPWNLEMGEHSCLAPFVDCYNVAKVTLGDYCTVSQYSYLCAATHDYTRLSMPLVPKPIRLGRRVWIAADVFVGPGVTVGDGAVVGARSSVFRDVPSWTVVAGSPAKPLKPRVVTEELAGDVVR